MSERVTASLRRAVIARAQRRCEYCYMPDVESLVAHEPDHIVATQHGGQTTLDNLAYACFQCNRAKGPNLTSLDPSTGQITPLFHPRTDAWNAHFRWNEAVIEPLTTIGRATAFLLRLNDPDRVATRANLMRQARY